MSVTAGCVPEIELYQAFRRELSPEAGETVMRHVLGCALCHDTWKRFEADAQMACGIRSALQGDASGADAAAERSSDARLPEELAIPGFTIRPEYLEGGQARVFRGTYEASQEDVAIKVFRKSALNEGGVGRFVRELKSLARLRHPNVVPIRSDGEVQGHPYFVMPWIEGWQLDHYVREHTLTHRQKAELVARICDALVHAHGRGVLHLDLKPSNVRVDLNGEPVVLDFGLAQAAESGGEPFIASLSVAGTPAYMAPEQARNRDDLDARADIYSLGLLMYEVLTGRRARAADVESGERVPLEVALERPPRPRDVCAGVNAELQAIVLKAIEPNRNRRYPTADQFYADLQRFLTGQSVQAMGTSWLYRARKFVAARPGPTLVAVLVLLVSGFGVAMKWEYDRMEHETSARMAQLFLRTTQAFPFLIVARGWEELGDGYREVAGEWQQLAEDHGSAEARWKRAEYEAKAHRCHATALEIKAWVKGGGEGGPPPMPFEVFDTESGHSPDIEEIE